MSYAKSSRALPLITDPAQLGDLLATWKSTLRQAVRSAVPPPPPFNFAAVSARGGNQLSWAPVDGTVKGVLGKSGGPDGYEILRSPSGDFVSDLTIISVPNTAQTTYFDSVGGPSKSISYRIRTTSGTANRTHAVKGPSSGTIQATSIDSNDTITVPVTTRDSYTTDLVRATARTGNYRNRF